MKSIYFCAYLDDFRICHVPILLINVKINTLQKETFYSIMNMSRLTEETNSIHHRFTENK